MQSTLKWTLIFAVMFVAIVAITIVVLTFIVPTVIVPPTNQTEPHMSPY